MWFSALVSLLSPETAPVNTPPPVHLDSTSAEAPAPTRGHDGRTVAVGKHTTLTVDGDWFASMLGPDLIAPHDRDVVERGWRGAATLAHDFGPFSVAATAGLGHVDGVLETGTYRTLALSISKTHRFSKWVTAWIALTVASQQWIGSTPPAGDPSRTTFMLTIGGTFK